MTAALRWGIIGTGKIAQTFASDLQHIDEGVVRAVGSRTTANADSFGERFGVAHRYGSYEELVEDPEVDAVYVATPHPMHHADARMALDHGKPVLVEKSFTMTAVEARDLVSVARERGLFMMEAMWTRFLPHVVAIRELIAQGMLGSIVLFQADHGKWFAKDSRSRLFAPELGGGALLDLGIYPVSFASMLLGPPSRITAMIEPAFSGVDGQTSMLFGYEAGAHAVLTCTSGARSATRASIVGTDARIEVDGDFYAPSSFSLITRDGVVSRYEFSVPGRGLQFEALEVAARLTNGDRESLVMPLDETVTIMETMEEVLGYM